MKSQAITGNYQEANVDAIAVAVFKDEKASGGFLKDLNTLTGGLIASVIKSEEFTGKEGETVLLHVAPKGKVKASRILLVGIGEKTDYKTPNVAILAGTATRILRKLNVKSFALVPRSDAEAREAAAQAMQGVVTSLFELDKYKTKEKNDKAIDTFAICVEGANEKELKAGLERGEIIGESINFTRDLSNEPPNILTPTEMAKRAQQMAKETGLKCEILDEKQMQKLGMGSLLSVSYGSEQPAKLIFL